MPDYKSEDREKILRYIAARAGQDVSVDDIVCEAGADRLRVHPLLFELEREGYIAVVARRALGAPAVVRLVKTA